MNPSKALNSEQSGAFATGVAASPSPVNRAGSPNQMQQQMNASGPMPNSNTDLRGAKNKFYDSEGVPSIPNGAMRKV